MWIRQLPLLFYHQVSFNLYLLFHFHILILVRRFSHEQFSISNYFSILHAVWNSSSHELELQEGTRHHIQWSLQELQLFFYYRLPWFHFCFELHTLPFNPHLHEDDSCWTKNLVSFTPDIKLNTFKFMFFFFFIWNTNSRI